MNNLANEVKIGNTVFVKIENSCYQYTISDSKTFDVNKKEISPESPIGRGLLGRRINEVVEISLPSETKIKCEILKIT